MPTIMRAPSLLAQCLPGLISAEKGCHVSVISDRDGHLPSPAVEIVPSKVSSYLYVSNSINSAYFKFLDLSLQVGT